MPQVRNLDSVFADVQKSMPTRKVNFEKKDYSVPNLFKPTFKDKKFQVILRLLPCLPNESSMYIENLTHMLELPNGKYLGFDCLRKFDNPDGTGKMVCPACIYNNAVWTKFGSDRNVARQKQLPKAKPKYYCNVLVVRNPNAPETEGQIFRFEFKAQVMKIISDAMNDKKDELDGTITPGVNPFSWYGPMDEIVKNKGAKPGANFVFVGEEGPQGPSYSKSHFSEPRRICKFENGVINELQDSEIDEIEKNLYTLNEFEHKLNEVQSMNSILNNYKKKTGMEFFAEFPELMAKYNTNGSTSPVNTSAPTQFTASVEVDDDDLFGTPEPPKPLVEEKPKETVVSNDAFFQELMGM